MKRNSIKIENDVLIDPLKRTSSAGFTTASLPRYGGEVLFQSTSDFQSLNIHLSEERVIVPSPKKISPSWTDGTIPFKVFIVIISGCFSSIPFEMIMRLDRGSGMFTAFFLHIYTVAIGIPTAYKEDYLVRSKMPVAWHVGLVSLSFLFIIFKTAAVENMPMPLFIVGSNMQLAAGVVIGYFVDGYRYSLGQMFSVLCVTCGCIIVTLDGDNFVSSLGILHTMFGLFCITTAGITFEIIFILIITKFKP